MMLWMRWAMMKVVRFFIRILHRLADLRLGFGVHRGGGIIQDEDARILQQGARDGDALLLPAGDGHPALADQGLVAVREGKDDIMYGSRAWRPVPLPPAIPPARRRR